MSEKTESKEHKKLVKQLKRLSSVRLLTMRVETESEIFKCQFAIGIGSYKIGELDVVERMRTYKILNAYIIAELQRREVTHG